jgi:hypothetical protein
LKKYERDALLPLYQEHAEYLLRAIKTGDIIDQIYAKIDTYIEVATCHEIAINSLSELNLETHQNRLGKEREYTNHEKAKNVGRDLRVRLVWMMIKNEIERDSSLSDYDVYEEMNLYADVYCPFCNTRLFVAEKEYFEVHEDGTDNFRYNYVVDGWCEHIFYTGMTTFNHYDDITDFQEDLEDKYRDIKDLRQEYDLLIDNDIFEDLYMSFNEFCQSISEKETVYFNQGDEYAVFYENADSIREAIADMQDAMDFIIAINYLDE